MSLLWWVIFAGIILAWLLFKMWSAWDSEENKLGIQAANLGWSAYGRFKDDDGVWRTKFARGAFTSCIATIENKAKVILLDPFYPIPFNSFYELESFIQEQGNGRHSSFPLGLNNPDNPLHHTIKR